MDLVRKMWPHGIRSRKDLYDNVTSFQQKDDDSKVCMS